MTTYRCKKGEIVKAICAATTKANSGDSGFAAVIMRAEETVAILTGTAHCGFTAATGRAAVVALAFAVRSGAAGLTVLTSNRTIADLLHGRTLLREPQLLEV